MKTLAALALLLFTLCAFAQRPINPKPGKMPDDVEEPRQWEEEKPEPPALSEQKDWIAFEVSSASDNRFFVDAKSLSIGKDGVLRYVVVIEGGGGARNVRFEGMRCGTREHKTYALGRPDGTWSEPKFAKWDPVEFKGANSYQKILFSDFFCPGKVRVASAKEALSALRAGIHPRAKVGAFGQGTK
jgi:CNP1-like family